MQGGRGRGRGVGGPGMNPFFDLGDPFSGFGSPANLMSGFFGGANPFSDPFFSSSPFGGGNLFGDPFFARPMIGESMFGGSGFFGPMGSPFMNAVPSGFIGHQEAPEPRPSRSRGPIIEEIDSDEEEEEDKEDGGEIREKPRKHRRLSNGPYVEEPEDKIGGRQLQQRNDYSEMNHQRHLQSQPQSRSFTFQSSSTVTYGGPNGAYYTASNTRRTGSDGVTFEESKEADTSTRQATHKVSKGLHNKGHSYTRKLNSDGKVDTMQTLHNLNEDELPVFEEAWNGSAQKHLPGWTGRENAGGSGRGGLALPSTETSHRDGRSRVSEARHIKNGVPRGRARD